MTTRNSESAEANAKLIAVAPELLEALKNIIQWSAHLPQLANDDILKAKEALKKVIE